MDQAELQRRTKKFALRIFALIDSLPKTQSGRIIAAQLGRAGSSVGANYRAACRARSKAEFIAKLGIVEEEADEPAYWIELAAGLADARQTTPLLQEANELAAIIVASIKTSRHNRNRSPQ